MARAHARDEESTAELEFGHARVTVTMAGGVWRGLDVHYEDGHSFSGWKKDCAALLKDKRCEHVRSVRIDDINMRVARALARLRELEQLTVYECGRFAPPPGMWPQLRRLTVKAAMSEDQWNYSEYGSEPHFDDLDDVADIMVATCIFSDMMVSALVAAAPNVRELSINWTERLDCLADILDGLPLLEKLQLDYANVDDKTNESYGTWPIVDSKPLDSVTPANLRSMRLRQRTAPPGRDEYDASAMASMAELAAALGRMQGRTGNRFTVELMGGLF